MGKRPRGRLARSFTMCLTWNEVLLVVALAIVSGADWERTAREYVRRRLLGAHPSPEQEDSE